MELMNTEVLGGFTVMHLMLGAIGLLLALIAVQSLLKKRDDDSSLHVAAWCAPCGWRGKLSKYQRKCPRCGGEVQKGEQAGK